MTDELWEAETLMKCPWQPQIKHPWIMPWGLGLKICEHRMVWWAIFGKCFAWAYCDLTKTFFYAHPPNSKAGGEE